MAALRTTVLISLFVASIYAEPAHILICGSAQVLESALAGEAGHPTLRTVWTWRPEHSAGLPLELMSNFAGTDECKPVDSGSAILITTSGNALAMVDRPVAIRCSMPAFEMHIQQPCYQAD